MIIDFNYSELNPPISPAAELLLILAWFVAFLSLGGLAYVVTAASTSPLPNRGNCTPLLIKSVLMVDYTLSQEDITGCILYTFSMSFILVFSRVIRSNPKAKTKYMQNLLPICWVVELILDFLSWIDLRRLFYPFCARLGTWYRTCHFAVFLFFCRAVQHFCHGIPFQLHISTSIFSSHWLVSHLVVLALQG